MGEDALSGSLQGLPLGELRYLPCTGSTNADMAEWLAEAAPDMALMVADEQTAGRGRGQRRWFTPPGAALAFSLGLRPPFMPALAGIPASEPDFTALSGLLSGLGAVAVVQALQHCYGIPAQIKWPNDVLIQGRKVCGILAEAHWLGSQLTAVILGIGLNVYAASLPSHAQLAYPATCLAEHTHLQGDPGERWRLLRAIIEQVVAWRVRLRQAGGQAEFLQTWQNCLAFVGEWVRLFTGPALDLPASQSDLEAQVLGLDEQAGLRLQDCQGHIHVIRAGEIHLRPVQDSKMQGGSNHAG